VDPSLRNRAAIVGVGETDISRASGRGELQLALEATVAALADCGLDAAEVDGIVRFGINAGIGGGILDETAFTLGLGIPELRFLATGSLGGADSMATLQMAAELVAAGARAVLVFRALNGRSGRRYGQPTARRDARADDDGAPAGALLPRAAFLAMPEQCGLALQRYMHRTGMTNEDCGRYAVQARAYAATNPAAYFYGQPISLDDHQNARWIAPPVLRVLDCALEVDSAVAFIVTSTERALDLRQPPVAITAAAASVTAAGSPIYFPGYDEPWDGLAMSRDLWASAGLGPADMDAVMIYDNFTPTVHLTLEANGFCAPGEAKEFVHAGGIALDGRLPVNTHGGHIHQGYHGHGLGHVAEAVKQIRGTAANQIARPVNHVATSAYRTGAVLSRV
jgi:acetyl-CoA acetyltransferase